MWKKVTILGAGFAGSEAALQLAAKGIAVTLIDAKPAKQLPVYNQPSFCELVCNNSFGNVSTDTPLGFLLAELDFLGSIVIQTAKSCMVNDVRTLSVDKFQFSKTITRMIQNAGIDLRSEYITELPSNTECLIIATGPLTNESLTRNITEKYNVPEFHFNDVSAPVIALNSIDLTNPHIQKINDDLYQIEIPEDIFVRYHNALAEYSGNKLHNVEFNIDFDRCMTIEDMARVNIDYLRVKRYTNPELVTPSVYLRRETALSDAFILVYSFTAMNHREQQRIFSMLPSLEHLRIVRYGRQHRNTYFDSPGILDSFFKVKDIENDVYILGQLSGLDGYASAISSGYIAAQHIIHGAMLPVFPHGTMIGELARYVSDVNVTDFQPMSASFSLFENTPRFGLDVLKKYKSAYLDKRQNNRFWH